MDVWVVVYYADGESTVDNVVDSEEEAIDHARWLFSGDKDQNAEFMNSVTVEHWILGRGLLDSRTYRQYDF